MTGMFVEVWWSCQSELNAIAVLTSGPVAAESPSVSAECHPPPLTGAECLGALCCQTPKWMLWTPPLSLKRLGRSVPPPPSSFKSQLGKPRPCRIAGKLIGCRPDRWRCAHRRSDWRSPDWSRGSAERMQSTWAGHLHAEPTC